VTRPRYLIAGEAALSVEFGTTIDLALHAQVQALDQALAAAPPPGVIECVPSYRSLSILFDPLVTDHERLIAAVDAILADPPAVTATGRTLVVPVAYSAAWGEDLPWLAAQCGLSEAEVVRRHTAATYRVYMIGFIPGFTYLGGLDPALHTPRRVSPRLVTPSGSVAIGGQQTGINPMDMPSGWHLIGRTPLTVFDPQREDRVFLFAAGDDIRFEAIDDATYARLAADRSALPRDIGPAA
jgi:KipI family sensor histidine kinase inhibitor